MTKITKPLLASKVEDLNKIKYPCYATKKIDGIRALMINGHLVSRTFKPIPNNYIRSMFETLGINGLDGELIVKNKPFNELTGDIMREDGTPVNVVYCVFDLCTNIDRLYLDRMKDLEQLKLPAECKIEKILPITINNEEELIGYYNKCVNEGWEGIMIRCNGKYKCGRSSENEGILLKLKPIDTEEATVIGFEEQMTNNNEKEKDVFGRSKRSSNMENLIPANTMGALLVRDIKSGLEFAIGTGYTAEQRKHIWENQNQYLGKTLSYNCQACGRKNLPRFPSFKSWRNMKIDG